MAKRAASAGGWLFKEEPTHYSFNDLQRDGSTVWSGVANNLARKHLREIQAGDRVLYFHTGKERAIVGEMKVTEGPRPDPKSDDPKSVVVTVEAVRAWPKPVTLAQIKEDSAFAGWDLLRISRLSVVPVNADQWKRLEQLAELRK